MGNVAIFKGKLVKFLAKAGILIPKRATTDRSLTPEQGETAFNTTDSKLEVWDGTTWVQISAGGGGSGTGLSHPTTNSTFESGTNNPTMTGGNNTALGVSSGIALISGQENTLVGSNAGAQLALGGFNVLVGSYAGTRLTGGSNNVAVGRSALRGPGVVSVSSNVAVGTSAGYSVVGNNNTFLGTNADCTSTGTANNNIAIGYGAGVKLVLPDISESVAIGSNTTVQYSYGYVLGTSSHSYRVPGIFNTPITIGPGRNVDGTYDGQTGILKFSELNGNGTNTVGFKAPDSIAADVTWTLPAADGTSGQVLSTSGTGTLSWVTAGGGGAVSGDSITGPIYSRASGASTKIYGKTASTALTTRAVSTWTTKSYWPTTINANSVCWSPELGIFVSVGSQGTLTRAATSSDGFTWTPRTTPESNTFNSVCWSSALGIFCAVASTGTNRVMTSSDGINWNARAAASGTSWRSVAWSAELGLFVAVAATTGATMYSTNGITWTSGTGTSGTYQLFAVTWSSELGIFVATGPGVTATSSNGTSWTETAVASLTAVTNMGLCWSPDLGLFVAVTDSSGVFATSTNGTTWTVRTSPASANQWVSVAWSAELGIFCASAITGTGTRLATSTDGITWTLRTNPVDNAWRSICWSAELGVFCAVSSSAAINNGAMLSLDVGIYRERKVVPKYFYRAAQSSEASKTLKTFTIRSSPAMDANIWNAICRSPELGIFVAVGDGSSGGTFVATSSDGITWTTQTPSIVATIIQSVCWSPEKNLFVAVALTNNVNGIMTSPDGINWTTRVKPTANALLDVCWSPERSLFCAVGSNVIYTSTDGTTWVSRTPPSLKNWRSVCWSSETSQFCAVASTGGSTSTIATSTDGITWVGRTSIDTNGLGSVIWSPERGMFVAQSFNIGSNHIAVSYNGVDWSGVSIQGIDPSFSIDGPVVWCAELGIFIATSYSSIFISTDGINWNLYSSNSISTGFNNTWDTKIWSSDLNIFVFLSTSGTIDAVITSRKSNIMSEILNLGTSRQY